MRLEASLVVVLISLEASGLERQSDRAAQNDRQSFEAVRGPNCANCAFGASISNDTAAALSEHVRKRLSKRGLGRARARRPRGPPLRRAADSDDCRARDWWRVWRRWTPGSRVGRPGRR
ncbi:hypothetical protein M885DRAFT_327084 [Pelagophyceae sp. CCMP2097]|nr:hypothetical protein M885DRAFT_327084 [Pelagophyceae sp. CCMP2097]